MIHNFCIACLDFQVLVRITIGFAEAAGILRLTDSLASARACDPNLDDADVGVDCDFDVKNFPDVVFCDILGAILRSSP